MGSNPRRTWIAVITGMVAGYAVLIALFWWGSDWMMAVAMTLSLAGLLLSLRDRRLRRACAPADATAGPPS